VVVDEYRHFAGHRFQHRDGHHLEERWKDEYIHAPVQVRHLAPRQIAHDPVPPRQCLSGQSFNLTDLLRRGAREQKKEVGGQAAEGRRSGIKSLTSDF
jgi:hypothetical protein